MAWRGVDDGVCQMSVGIIHVFIMYMVVVVVVVVVVVLVWVDETMDS